MTNDWQRALSADGYVHLSGVLNAAEVSGLLNMGRGLGTAVGVAVTSVLLSVTAGTWASGRATAVVAWVLCAVAAAGAVLAEAASRGTASTSGARGVVGPADAA